MDVFAFRKALISEYAQFSRSFTKINANDILDKVNEIYRKEYFWPAPLVQLNPNFESGGYVKELVEKGFLHPECGQIFRIGDHHLSKQPLRLYRHQTEAIKIAVKRESYVLTTGTGSGKSLAYFIPIVNDVLRRKAAGDMSQGITAIVVYPMNALCNSQFEELEKYLGSSNDRELQSVTFARYTGQEESEERDQIAQNPPDILLTNYVMLELIMTRFVETDKAVRRHAEGLRYLVLDELHTYRGRQGADVAMLVRRVRERFNDQLMCIGTSATMISEGSHTERHETVAGIASRIFGVTVKPENVISETLRPVTASGELPSSADLRTSIQEGIPKHPTYEELSMHPMSTWVEQKMGLEKSDGMGKFVRISSPLSIHEASECLGEYVDLDSEICEKYLTDFLLMAHQCKNEKGLSFFAFRLHQFISRAWSVYTTLDPPGKRYVTLEGQQFKPGDRTRPLYVVCFCRECGQEYIPVWATFTGDMPVSFSPRDLNDHSIDDEGTDLQHGYLIPQDPDESVNFDSADIENKYPENWLEFRGGSAQLKTYYRRFAPIRVQVSTKGEVIQEGLSGWFISGKFRFCLNQECDAYYEGNIRELTKLSGLSSEGRSSATTILTLSALKHLIGTELDDETKKILAFTDNRQDASLQAGHFNDFIQILMLRGALLAAIQKEPSGLLKNNILTQKVLDHLHLDVFDYAASPQAKGYRAKKTIETLRDILGYRLYFDLQRGWRITNPNLEQLGLLEIRYRDLLDCCEDEEEWQACHPMLGFITPEQRMKIAQDILDRMRKSLCIRTIYLNSERQEKIRNDSHNLLKEPWGLSEDERMYPSAYMIPRPRMGRRNKDRNLYISHRSTFGKNYKSKKFWGIDNPYYPDKFGEDLYNRIVDDILSVLLTYGFVDSADLSGGITGYTINSSILEWHYVEESPEAPLNEFFYHLYKNIADSFRDHDRLLHQLEAREHTAQVDSETRKDRESRFRRGLTGERVKDQKSVPAGLPVLFCSPTMELGVDIASLNAVYMRNVPPTPANYAQRSGRAGRSGQPALVITYCASQSPHDQYFFSHPTRMVSGVVSPPSIDLANEDLIRSHLQAVWLTETGMKLGNSVSEIIDRMDSQNYPLSVEIASQIHSSKIVSRATTRAQRILHTLEQELSPQDAPWYTDTWLESAMRAAERRFDDAFNRWRSLFRATVTQISSANNIINNAAATEQDRWEAKKRYDEAYTQQNLLLGKGRAIFNSDFYTYRYLAGEGFLPGYNFPRLPLMAFIPGRRRKIGRDSFLSRPRFLGLSEFGPRAIIYHEGSTYRVQRAILSPHDESEVTISASLPIRPVMICLECGYGHFGDQSESERCFNCDVLLEGGRRIHNLYHIEQVSTQRVTRITSDEEERRRQGFETITTLRFSEENGRARSDSVMIEANGKPLLELRYAPSTTLWRINLGWHRRKEKTAYGFYIDANTGVWAKDSQATTEAEDDLIQERQAPQRITPFVKDTRNVLVLNPLIDLDNQVLVTLQYAIKRGIEQEFQLEESELAAEPLPDSDRRKTILFYESAEGGAGVLTRLTSDPDAFARVSKRALEICHYRSKSGTWSGPDDLENLDEECEAGCYRCLLSYYNQLDHSLIDRQNEDFLTLLCKLSGSSSKIIRNKMELGALYQELVNASSSSLEREWLDFITSNCYALPDRAQPNLKAYETRPDFAYNESQALIYIDGPHHQAAARKRADNAIDQRLENSGYAVIRFPTDQKEWPEIIEKYAWVFRAKSA